MLCNKLLKCNFKVRAGGAHADIKKITLAKSLVRGGWIPELDKLCLKKNNNSLHYSMTCRYSRRKENKRVSFPPRDQHQGCIKVIFLNITCTHKKKLASLFSLIRGCSSSCCCD